MHAAPGSSAQRSRRIFRSVLVLSALTTASGPLVDLFDWLLGGNGPILHATSIFNLMILAVLPGLWLLERRGYYRVVSLIWLGLSILTITIIAYFYGGALSPISTLYLLPIVTSGFLLNSRAIFSTALIAALGYLALALNDTYHLIRPPDPAVLELPIFNALHLGAIVLQALATWLLTTNLAGALKVAQQRGLDLERERTSLAETVQLRTSDLSTTVAEAQRRASSLHTIHTVTQHMMGHTEPQLLLQSLVTQLHEYFHYRCVSVFTYEGQDTPEPFLRLQACFIDDHLVDGAGTFIQPASMGIFGHVAQTGRSYYAPDTRVDPQYVGNPLEIDFYSEMSVPMRIGQSVIGVLSIADRAPAAFTSEDQRVIEMVADQLAVAVEHAQLFADLNHRRKLADILRYSSQELSASLHVATVLQRLMELCFEVVPTTQAVQLTYQQDLEHVCDLVRSADGTVSSLVHEGSMDLGVEPASTPVWIGAIPAYGDGVLSSSTYVLSIGDETLATLAVYNSTGRPSAADDPMLELCRLAEQALNNARLYAILRLISTITRDLSADLSLDALLARLATHLVGYVPFQALSLILCHNTAPTFSVVAAHPEQQQEHPPAEVVQAFVAGLVATHEVAFFQASPRQVDPHPRFVEHYQLRGYQALGAVPMTLNNTTLGILSLHSQHLRPFTDYHQRLLDRLAPHLAQAIHTVQLFNQRDQALANVQSAQNELLRATRLRTLGELASGMAHDFNNMLTGILGNVELLLLDETDAERRESLEVISQAARDGAQSVRRLHEFARNKSEQTHQLINLNDLVREALILTRHRWKGGSKYPPFQIDQDLDLIPEVLANPTELREVLVNLLLNAFDAMQSGGTLTIESTYDDQQIQMSIGDTGVGIDPQIQQTLFTPFISTKGSTGLGLGLAVSFNTMKRHGGDLQFTTQPGQGTTFVLTLPLLPDVAEQPASPSELSPLDRPVKARRVLLVDDDDETRLVLARMLQSHQQIVTALSNGHDAIDLLRTQPSQFDLVVTDLGMPKLNGWEVARLVREITPALSIILITGWGFQIEPEEARTRGVDAVIAKPVTLDTLRMVLNSLEH